jgi:hypothetical protein
LHGVLPANFGGNRSTEGVDVFKIPEPYILLGGKLSDTARDRVVTKRRWFIFRCSTIMATTTPTTTPTTWNNGQSKHGGFPLKKPRYEDAPVSVPLFGGIRVSVGSYVEVAIDGTLLVTQVSEEKDPASKTIWVNLYRSVEGSDLEASIPCLSGIAQDTSEVFQTDEYHDI